MVWCAHCYVIAGCVRSTPLTRANRPEPQARSAVLD